MCGFDLSGAHRAGPGLRAAGRQSLGRVYPVSFFFFFFFFFFFKRGGNPFKSATRGALFCHGGLGTRLADL